MNESSKKNGIAINLKSYKLHTVAHSTPTAWVLTTYSTKGNIISRKYITSISKLATVLLKYTDLRKRADVDLLKKIISLTTELQEYVSQYTEKAKEVDKIDISVLAGEKHLLTRSVKGGSTEIKPCYWNWSYINSNNKMTSIGKYGSLKNLLPSIMESVILDLENVEYTLEELYDVIQNEYVPKIKKVCEGI